MYQNSKLYRHLNFWGVFPFLSSWSLYSQFSSRYVRRFKIMADKIPGSGAKWEEGELDQLECRGRIFTENHFSCDWMTETEKPVRVSALPWPHWKGNRKHFTGVFSRNMKPKLHKNVHSCLQPISESLEDFHHDVPLPEKSPELPIAPLIGEKLEAFRFCQMMRVWFPPERISWSASMTLLNQLDAIITTDTTRL